MIKHNHVAIVAAVILHQAIGFLWYSPLLFLLPWVAGLGQRAGDLNMSDPIPFIADIAGWFCASYFISWFEQHLEVRSFNHGIGLAVLLWVGVALPLMAPHYLFAGIGMTVLLIDATNALVQLIVTCCLLALWRKR